MTCRGTVSITSTDDDELRKTEYVQENLHPEDGSMYGCVLLDEVNWLDSFALIRQAPSVGWIAYMDSYTESPNVAIVHLPGADDRHFVSHVDHEVVVPLYLIEAHTTWEDLMAYNSGLAAYVQLQRTLDEVKQ